MKKKNLLILLIIPFLVSTLTIVTVNVTYNMVDVDISYIEWNYDDVEAFMVTDTLYPLNAVGVNKRHVDVGKGNELIWSVKNVDGTSSPYAQVLHENGRYYLKTLSNGDVEVSCSNQKGNVSRSFRVIVYTDGAIIISSDIPSSKYGKIDSTEYFGTYDLDNGDKRQANFGFTVKLIPASLKDANPVITSSENLGIDFSFDNGKEEGGGFVVSGTVRILSEGKSDISVTTDLEDAKINGGRYDFTAVKDGVNVYTYDDLLYCTNRSNEGEITVLHKSFESYDAYINSRNQSTACFGYPNSSGRFSFNGNDGTLYRYKTKYNHEYLDQWNAFSSNKVDPSVSVGLRVQKDFYGNGYQINFHNLAYPSGTREENGMVIPTLSSTDNFRGPLPFYTVGSPSNSGADGMNIVTAFGQDNIGLLIEGDGITVNDLKVQNCDDVNVFYFLDTVGTVVEVDGDNITLKNMRMSNGKNVLRSYSSMDLLVQNCMLSNARNFLFITGSNEYVKADVARVNNFTTPNGAVSARLSEFLTKESVANSILNDYLNGKIGANYSYKNKEQLKKTLTEIQSALSTDLSGQFKGSTNLKDCLFYRSGIASVAFESLFNGPFLYNSQLPTSIAMFLNLLNGGFMPTAVSGTSYPVSVNVSGNTRFYDYKAFDDIDVSGLIDENISTLAQMLNKNYTIDNIFPIKSLLKYNAVTYDKDGVEYVNIPFAYYGGGENYSRLTFNGYEDNHINGRLNGDGTLDENAVKKVNLLDDYLDLPVVDPVGFLGQLFPPELLEQYSIEVDENTLIKTVTIVTGYKPFKFIFTKGDGYLYGESPKIEEMQAAFKTAAQTEAYNA